ncbi:glutamine--fructose-6-phosphate aminotransferase [Coxiella burnetii]|uniref:Glutamine--fructose-6-phosphate aminotransferase [isomerizing] n=1 Tax=Coxiella burnetii (strain Dugway 5J108-111) TaxID=434922 RepID=A9KEV8_COXBN|nr:glutamine--fructose-6-phosphate transaminase (isomerizing) [Coxiella burnetii]ABS77694.1 glucosamine--fructose-6-phosphate aminotransferase (isomerizing) [Coxiella burnetii Dugway 5J108-111]OYK83171.1 glutamine--fructose-6-phosphate aminotransferase [Coxiella burnetii]
MCGIVGAVAERPVADILLEGLNRLEYRGYDSAGMALLHPKTHQIQCVRVKGKVAALVDSVKKKPLPGKTGIAHTRWATHGEPSQKNAHPHCSEKTIAVVHNGIIENHDALRRKLTKAGYKFKSETDTEVIAHLIHYHLQSTPELLTAIHQTTKSLKGAYALGIISTREPETLYAVRCGSPLVIGLGIGENFIASDQLALLPVTQRFIYLEEGDIVKIGLKSVAIYDKNKKAVKRTIHATKIDYNATGKGKYRHYMQKEIFEQPQAVLDTINNHFSKPQLTVQRFGSQTASIFKKIQRIQLVACGTSYHAALVGRYWLEALAGIPCQVEVASENRYRQGIVEPNTLFVALSQSGETADTLAALRQAKKAGYAATLGICNVPQSSLAREADLIFLTRAGAEIGVAATKTFTTQLVALLLLTFLFHQNNQKLIRKFTSILPQLKQLPALLQKTLELDRQIKQLSKRFNDKEHALFLGRGAMFPIALEGALKLKEISYMHAEAYPAGELKHGPLALVDKGMPVIVVAPNDHLIEKLASNMQEVQARGGELYAFVDHRINWQQENGTTLIKMPPTPDFAAPIAYTIPLQLLAYHIAVLKGTDVDQPRNLAKSVTVE